MDTKKKPTLSRKLIKEALTPGDDEMQWGVIYSERVDD